MAKAIDDEIDALEKKQASTKPGTSNKCSQTDDTSNLALWLILLFASGGVTIGTTFVSRKKKYKLNVTNFPFFVIVNSLSLLRPFPSFSDIVPHIHLKTNIHNDYEYGLYYRMFQYIQKLVYMHECS